MDLLAIILACSLHPDDALVRTLVDVQSGGTVLFVGDLATLTMNDSLPTTAAALRFVAQIRRRGGRPAVGLLGIPLEWASRYGLGEADLFDACVNISVGTAALSEYYDRCPSKPRRRSRQTGGAHPYHSQNRPVNTSTRGCILKRFAADLGVTGAPGRMLMAIAKSAEDRSSGSLGPPPARAAIFGSDPASEIPAVRWVDTSKDAIPTRATSSTPVPKAAVAPSTRAGSPLPAGGDEIRVVPGRLPSAATAAAARVPRRPLPR